MGCIGELMAMVEIGRPSQDMHLFFLSINFCTRCSQDMGTRTGSHESFSPRRMCTRSRSNGRAEFLSSMTFAESGIFCNEEVKVMACVCVCMCACVCVCVCVYIYICTHIHTHRYAHKPALINIVLIGQHPEPKHETEHLQPNAGNSTALRTPLNLRWMSNRVLWFLGLRLYSGFRVRGLGFWGLDFVRDARLRV